MLTNISKPRLIVAVILLLLLALGTWHTLQPKKIIPATQSHDRYREL